MARLSRTHIAVGGTVAALGALGAVALAAGSNAPEGSAAQAPAEVRTIVERRTETVVRHERPRRAADGAGSRGTDATAGRARIVPIDAVAPAPSQPAEPLRSGSSGSGDDDHEDHNERGDVEDHDEHGDVEDHDEHGDHDERGHADD